MSNINAKNYNKKHEGRIFLLNHREIAVVGEVVRQFFGKQQAEDNLFRVESEKAFTLYCATIEEIDPEHIRSLMRGTLSAANATELPEKVHVFVQLQQDHDKWFWRETCPPEDLRRTMRRLLHLAFSQHTGLDFPWGSLNGVRPTQVAAGILSQSRVSHLDIYKDLPYSVEEKEQAFVELTDFWKVSRQKAELAIETAVAEENILKKIDVDSGDYIVYVGLPFCPSRCHYCSFITEAALSQKEYLPLYVDAIAREAAGLCSSLRKAPKAVYFGGGTPTSLQEELFARYLDQVLAAIPYSSDCEYTMEAGRPDSITEEKLKIIRAAKFDKLCINPQSMIDQTLKKIGRRHTVAQTVEAVQMARSEGFDDINMDLIAGIPGDASGGFLYSVKQVLQLEPESISLHSLSVKRGSDLDVDDRAGDPFLPNIPLIRQVERAHQLLRRAAYRPYYLYRQKTAVSGLENCSFTKGKASLYNVAMMSDQVPVIGLGSGATTKTIAANGKAKRQYNPKDLRLYIERIPQLIEEKSKILQPLYR